VPPLVLRPRVVGFVTTLFSGLIAAVLIAGCNRKPAPPADAKAPATATADAPTKAGAPADAKAGTPADPKGGPPGGTKGGPPNPAAAAEMAAKKKAADAEKDKARQTAAEQVPVETVAVTRGPISAFLAFNSTLETEASVDIYPQTGGQVEALYAEEGRIVQEGDPLLKIEDRELRVEVDDATNNFEHLTRNFARSDDLFKRNLINKQDYEEQKFQLEQSRLRLERAKIRLSYTTVRAPFAGVISARETQLGARVGSGTKVFSMVKLDEIVARVFVPGRYLPVVADNQKAVVTSEFLPDRSFTGWVKRISPVIDPKSGTFKVTVGVKVEKPSDLPPGLFVAVRVITDTRESAVLIPKRAVVYEGGERYVFIVAKDRATKRKLSAGFEDPQNIEALSGIQVGEQVIVLGHSGLKDGAPVRPVNALAPIPQAAADAGPKAADSKAAPDGKAGPSPKSAPANGGAAKAEKS
jgi:membrane fusion protein, multidrug efflux system